MFLLWKGSTNLAVQMHQLPSARPQLAASDRRQRSSLVGALRCIKADLEMNGLRVYIEADGDGAETRRTRFVFYSRREDGPYYRWVYDDVTRQWRVGRVMKSATLAKSLLAAAWKTLPVTLQRSIVEHYQD